MLAAGFGEHLNLRGRRPGWDYPGLCQGFNLCGCYARNACYLHGEKYFG